ncbi:MAG TPA: hypothetical protein VLM20_06290 [Methylophilaceae bacterium]|nr:hypothetical protein [Methylophilaceae bacterium]
MMINKKSAIIIGLQALLIVILFWMLVFYGKDEYEDFRTEQEEEIESLDRVTEEEGVSIVSLSTAVQKNSGITTERVKEMAYQDEVKSFGIVMPIDSLIEAKTALLNLNAELKVLEANSQQHQTQYERLKTLNEDDKNVSDLAVQQALAQINTDKAAINSKALEIENLLANAKLQWGAPLAKAALYNQSAGVFKKLLARENMLIQISLPFTAPEPYY